MAKKRKVKDSLVEITEAQFNRLARNKRCRVAGSSEGGATFVCGRSLSLALGHDGSKYHYYKMTGASAMSIGYSFKRRGGRATHSQRPQ